MAPVILQSQLSRKSNGSCYHLTWQPHPIRCSLHPFSWKKSPKAMQWFWVDIHIFYVSLHEVECKWSICRNRMWLPCLFVCFTKSFTMGHSWAIPWKAEEWASGMSQLGTNCFTQSWTFEAAALSDSLTTNSLKSPSQSHPMKLLLHLRPSETMWDSKYCLKVLCSGVILYTPWW